MVDVGGDDKRENTDNNRKEKHAVGDKCNKGRCM
jgi:hypothetical protein